VLGATAGLAVLAAIVLLMGPLLDRIPLPSLQLAIGILLLLFGMGWLRKASLRAAGIIPLHDEDAIFAAEAAQLGQHARRPQTNLDWVAGITALKAVLIEGLEVVFIVIAVGAGRGLLMPASFGALAACALVLTGGVIVHRPLSRVPENTLKFGVGVMLSAFGVFWTGEGLGVAWPGQDLALLLFAALFLAAGLVGSTLARRISVEIAQ
jgi:Ca2+/H+ antiporter, TMEM165/GDT1 family